MKVGDEYQAVIPDFISNGPYPEHTVDNSVLVWSPNSDIKEAKLDEYINESKEKCGYSEEQSLGMLYWCKYDVQKANADMLNYAPFSDEWSADDKALFEQQFKLHGKDFHKIRQMLPDKSIASLVKYYYSRKKKSCTSLMDRQIHMLSAQKNDGSDDDTEAPSENGIHFDDENKENKSESAEKANCSNCNVLTQLYSTPKGNLCHSCCQYLKRTGTMRRTSARLNARKSKQMPPQGMNFNYDDLVAVATGPPAEGDAILRSMDSKIISMKRQVQNNKQMISQRKHKTNTGIDSLRLPEVATTMNSRWSNDELLLAVQAIRKYGRDFKAVAEVIGNKTEANIKSFFVNYRRRFNLDGILQEYDAEHGTPAEKSDKKMESDTCPVANNSHPSSSTFIPQRTPVPLSIISPIQCCKS